VTRAFVLGGLALVLGAAGLSIVRKESTLRTGRVVLLRLAPVDPRSLMQGDYMDLAYAVARNVPSKAPADGLLVLADDPRGVARLLRVDDGTPLGPGEYLLRYRRRGSRVRLGAESFFFQEGTGKELEGARYGELRVTASGEPVLVGLRDDLLRPLGRR
jgi:uncharacterized membrane-anchored protein